MIDHKVRVRRKGQMTLPAEIREELNVGEGDLVTISKRDGNYIITAAESWADTSAGALAEYAKGKPPITMEEMDKAVEDGILESWNRFVREVEEEYDQ